MEVGIKCFVLLVIVVATTSCTESPEKCCVEPTHEVFMGGTIAQVINGSGVGILMNTQTAADHDQHMYGSEAGYYVIGGHYVEIKTIQDWNAMKSYSIMNGVCTVAPLVGSEPSNCIADDAKFSEYTNIGDNEIVTQNWEINPKEVGLSYGNAYLSISNKKCIPTGLTFAGLSDTTGAEVPIVYSAGYFNYTSGVSDPKRWFGVPSSCNTEVTSTNNKLFNMLGLNESVHTMSKLFQNLVFRRF
ncbi:development-specific protein LVN1.2-like [Apostichopus japonicus]|uniref:development-specific protein LVN1.2-like n=1 Tax=Stichopus japonicus TaxID=307972 RepID=UPI003AB8CF84